MDQGTIAGSQEGALRTVQSYLMRQTVSPGGFTCFMLFLRNMIYIISNEWAWSDLNLPNAIVRKSKIETNCDFVTEAACRNIPEMVKSHSYSLFSDFMPWCLILKKKNWLLPTYCHKSLNPHKAGCQKIRQGKFPFGFAMSVPAENIYYVQADVSFWPKKCCPQTFHIQLWFTK